MAHEMISEDGFRVCRRCGAAEWPDGSWWLAGATALFPPPCCGEGAGQQKWINQARHVPTDQIALLDQQAERRNGNSRR